MSPEQLRFSRSFSAAGPHSERSINMAERSIETSIIDVDCTDSSMDNQESADLSDDEWATVIELFHNLKEDYGDLWEALAEQQTRGTSTPANEKASQEALNLPTGAHKSLSSAAGLACGDECCRLETFVPLNLVEKEDTLTNALQRLDLNDGDNRTSSHGSTSKVSSNPYDEHERSLLDQRCLSNREMPVVAEVDDHASSNVDDSDYVSALKGESASRLIHSGVRPPSPSEASRSWKSSLDNTQQTTGSKVIEDVPSDEDAHDKHSPGHQRAPLLATRMLTTANMDRSDSSVSTDLFLEDKLDSHSVPTDEDSSVWSPPKCKSPRFASSVVTEQLGFSETKDYKSNLGVDKSRENAIRGDDMNERSFVNSISGSFSSEENSWDGSLGFTGRSVSTAAIPSVVSGADVIVIESESDVDDERDQRRMANPRPVKQVSKTEQLASKVKNSFKRNKHDIATSLFCNFDKEVFGDKLAKAGVEITWSKRLTSTAGKTILKRSGMGVYKADIELSAAILDSKDRLRATLLHEMCHAAAWIVDNNSHPPHGPVFKKWARIARRQTGIPVKTTHTYNIAKYAWACSTASCPVKVQRPTKSFKSDAFVCAKCGGRFVQVDTITGSPIQPKAKKALSGYNLFVKENSKLVREALQDASNGRKVTQSEVMTELAQRWKQETRNRGD